MFAYEYNELPSYYSYFARTELKTNLDKYIYTGLRNSPYGYLDEEDYMYGCNSYRLREWAQDKGEAVKILGDNRLIACKIDTPEATELIKMVDAIENFGYLYDEDAENCPDKLKEDE